MCRFHVVNCVCCFIYAANEIPVFASFAKKNKTAQPQKETAQLVKGSNPLWNLVSGVILWTVFIYVHIKNRADDVNHHSADNNDDQRLDGFA
jgi:hypothetical protein